MGFVFFKLKSEDARVYIDRSRFFGVAATPHVPVEREGLDEVRNPASRFREPRASPATKIPPACTREKEAGALRPVEFRHPRHVLPRHENSLRSVARLRHSISLPGIKNSLGPHVPAFHVCAGGPRSAMKLAVPRKLL